MDGPEIAEWRPPSHLCHGLVVGMRTFNGGFPMPRGMRERSAGMWNRQLGTIDLTGLVR